MSGYDVPLQGELGAGHLLTVIDPKQPMKATLAMGLIPDEQGNQGGPLDGQAANQLVPLQVDTYMSIQPAEGGLIHFTEKEERQDQGQGAEEAKKALDIPTLATPSAVEGMRQYFSVRATNDHKYEFITLGVWLATTAILLCLIPLIKK